MLIVQLRSSIARLAQDAQTMPDELFLAGFVGVLMAASICINCRTEGAMMAKKLMQEFTETQTALREEVFKKLECVIQGVDDNEECPNCGEVH